jgi:COP9 signalosome complex subunit 4
MKFNNFGIPLPLAGQERSRILATLFKDERCKELPNFHILEAM